MDFERQWWLLRSKLRFLRAPKERRVRLEIATDGRQLTYLLVSLAALGRVVQVVTSPMLFRELYCLRQTLPLGFICGGRLRECGLVISDRPEVVAQAGRDGIPALELDADYFGAGRTEARMPYFMHPMVYHRAWHRLAIPVPAAERPVRLGFFGTRDAEFYTRHFRFPMLNREEILAAWLREFGGRIWTAEGPLAEWPRRPMAMAIDTRGGDRTGKAFLPLRDYLSALRQCDFFLTPPGKYMPFSHNLIEGMAAGSVPVLNYPEYLEPALVDGVNCIRFNDIAGLKAAVERVLAMPAGEIVRMRRAVRQYYQEHLDPGKWLGRVLQKPERNQRILVNAEEVSLAVGGPGRD